MHMKYLVDITCTFRLAAILLKMALLSLSLNLEAQYCPGHGTNLGLPIAKELLIWFM